MKYGGHLLGDLALHLLVERDEVVTFLLPEVDLGERPRVASSSQLLARVLAENLLRLNIIRVSTAALVVVI